MNKYSDCLHDIVGSGIFKYDVNDTNILVLYSLRVREREREKMKEIGIIALLFLERNTTKNKTLQGGGKERLSHFAQ